MHGQLNLRERVQAILDVGFPRDDDGYPLAWPDPSGDGSYIDAWNGIYLSRSEALHEVRFWSATEGQRVLAFGEGAITQDEADERL